MSRPGFDPTTSILAGMSTDVLQAALASAQQAYLDLQTGAKVVTVSYGQGETTKAVTYTPATIAGLTSLVRTLQAQLGIVCRPRRAIGFRF